MKKALLWWFVNAGLAVMLYVGYFRGIEGAQNVVLFVVWLNFALCLALVPAKEVQQSIREKGRTVPAWVSVPYDVVMVAGMVWVGLWGTAVAFTLSSFIHNGIYMKDEQQEAA